MTGSDYYDLDVKYQFFLRLSPLIFYWNRF